VEVIDNKYVTNISCNLWSKQDDSNEFLTHYKNNLLNIEMYTTNLELISFDELYQNYKKYFKAKNMVEQRNLPIVSKQFFEKFISYKLTDYIRFEKFVSSEWLQN
jgi:hypothetical protein